MRLENPRLPPVYFDYIATANQTPNARAFKKDKGQYFIGFTSDLVFGLGLFFGRILADRRNLIHIGNPGACPELPSLVLPAFSLRSRQKIT